MLFDSFCLGCSYSLSHDARISPSEYSQPKQNALQNLHELIYGEFYKSTVYN